MPDGVVGENRVRDEFINTSNCCAAVREGQLIADARPTKAKNE
jgi:hypothetical protein